MLTGVQLEATGAADRLATRVVSVFKISVIVVDVTTVV